jgi:hypothetical protein
MRGVPEYPQRAQADRTRPQDAGPRAKLKLAAWLLAGGVAVTGCASAGSTMQEGVENWQPASHAMISSRGEALFPAEIRATSASSAYDAVLKLRPQFFASARAGGTGRAPVPPSVVLAGGFPESLEVLKQIQVDQVAQIRFIEPSDAVIRYGAAYAGGIIFVRLAP